MFSEEVLLKKGFIKDKNGNWSPNGVRKELSGNLDFEIEKVVAPKYLIIPNNVPSSKNSKQILWVFKPMMGKVSAIMKLASGKKLPVTPIISDSKLVKQYREDTKQYFSGYKKYFLAMIENVEPPYIIELQFTRKTKARFDFHNIVQVVFDMMVEYGWIEDDDIKNLLPVPPLPPMKSHLVSKEECGVRIRVINDKYVNK